MIKLLLIRISSVISATRDRQAGEITPVRAEHSATYENDEGKYGAGHAIDMYLETHSISAAGSDGASWLKVVLDQVHCVQKVQWYFMDAKLGLTWTCNINNCASCVGDGCNDFTLTVSTEGATPDLSPVSECRHGDTVTLERINGGSVFSVYEIVIIGRQGEKPTVILKKL